MKVTDAVYIPADGGKVVGNVGGGVFLSRQILWVLFDQSLIDRPIAELLVQAKHVAAIVALGEDRTERSGGIELVIEHEGEVRDETVQETITALNKNNLGGFG